jgi:hypothetical protein
MLGTWTLNLARSRYHPGPTPKSQVRVYEKSDEGTQEAVTTVNANGETVKVVFPGIYDGRIMQLQVQVNTIRLPCTELMTTPLRQF